MKTSNHKKPTESEKPDKLNHESTANQPATPPADLTAIKKQCEEYLSGWKRAQADYQNLKRETVEAKSEMAKYANQHTLESFLPLVDYFAYAFKQVPTDAQNSSWLQGMKHIQTSLLKILADHGVEPMKTLGEKFDHNQHESVAEIADTKQPSGTIIEEIAAGFTRHGQVIRHAKVKVAK